MRKARASTIAQLTNRVSSAYAAVARVFQAVASQSAADFKPVGEAAFVVHHDATCIHATCLSKIDRLPFKASGGGPKITAVLQSEEKFRVGDLGEVIRPCLTHSTVIVGYYRQELNQLNTLLCVRYDFHGAADAHPIFHAQIDAGAIGADEFSRLKLPPPVSTERVLHRIRIPTANVIGPTALLHIAADHLPHDQFHRVLNEFRNNPLFTKWGCDRSTLDRPKALGKLLSSTWYGLN